MRRGRVGALSPEEQRSLTADAVLSATLVQALQTDTFRVPFVISPRTYMLAAVITLLAAAGTPE